MTLRLSLAALFAMGLALPASPSEIPAGARFVVELRDKLEARKVKRGKKFEACTLEALRAADGAVIPAGARLKGREGEIRAAGGRGRS